jgi:hypothetical protein
MCKLALAAAVAQAGWRLTCRAAASRRRALQACVGRNDGEQPALVRCPVLRAALIDVALKGGSGLLLGLLQQRSAGSVHQWACMPGGGMQEGRRGDLALAVMAVPRDMS